MLKSSFKNRKQAIKKRKKGESQPVLKNKLDIKINSKIITTNANKATRIKIKIKIEIITNIKTNKRLIKISFNQIHQAASSVKQWTI
jgi:hypothetical protein